MHGPLPPSGKKPNFSFSTVQIKQNQKKQNQTKTKNKHKKNVEVENQTSMLGFFPPIGQMLISHW